MFVFTVVALVVVALVVVAAVVVALFTTTVLLFGQHLRNYSIQLIPFTPSWPFFSTSLHTPSLSLSL